MAEYSELIKRFDKIRNYMRDFYVYGFKSREDFGGKSLRTYDNEKRRIESYVSDLMSFRQDENGKNVFISVDSASVTSNPLYRAFKAKTFTKNDIALHFFILDILTQQDNLSAMEVADEIASTYLSFFENAETLDLSTVRNKLKEYDELGLLTSKLENKKLLYSLNRTEVNLEELHTALVYFSEVSPLGVVGSYILDNLKQESDHITFKHHYIMHALDSEVVFQMLEAMHQQKSVEILSHLPRARKEVTSIIVPLKLLISVTGGRRYICGYNHRTKAFTNYRLDNIKSIKLINHYPDFEQKRVEVEEILNHTWGVSFDNAKELEKLSITFNILPKEEYVLNRIQREGRNGTITMIDENTYQYDIEVYDAREMLTWVRTFIGRIKSLECSNKVTQEVFYSDLNKLYEMYGGESYDIQ